MGKLRKFDNVLNVRDFGGQAVAGGGQVVSGKLFRGAQISVMSSGDKKTFSDWGISLIVDMRYKTERTRQASNLSEGFNPDIFTLRAEHDQDANEGLAPHEQFVLHELKTPEDGHRYMLNAYAERPSSPWFISLVSRTIKRLTQQGDTLYIHCAAGKDRTGTFAAILLMALGVNADDVMEDYLATRQAVDLELVMGVLTKKMEQRYGRPFDQDALRPFFDVDPDYLLRSLAVIGDIHTYWHDVLGLTDQDLNALKSHYLISAGN